MSEGLVARIKRHEGLILKPKIDVPPMWEIGYGHDISAADAQDYIDGISQQQADDWLHEDIATAMCDCDHNFPWLGDLDQNRQEVLFEMAYQMGIGKLLQFHKMLSATQASDYATAAKEMLSSAWNDETPERCAELANIMLTGEVEDGAVS